MIGFELRCYPSDLSALRRRGVWAAGLADKPLKPIRQHTIIKARGGKIPHLSFTNLGAQHVCHPGRL